MAKDLAIVLNNGSLNSAVATALASQKYRVVMLFGETGSRGSERAKAAYEQQVAHFKPYREHALPVPFLAALGGAGPEAKATDPRMPVAVTPHLIDLVPMIGIAARFAAHYQTAALYVGLRVGGHGDELAQATEFVQIWQELLQMTCGQPELEVAAPLLELEAWQAVDVGCNVSAPFEKTWTCAEEGPEPCWACRRCRARDAAFQQAAKPDPLKAARKG
jgi:7-cyano-7-deazaguanine synthase in queuosine biosynthesis